MCWGPGMVLSPPRICCDSVGSSFSLVPFLSLPGAGFPEWEDGGCQEWGCRESGLQPGGGRCLRCGCWSAETQCHPVLSQSSLLSPRPQPLVHSSPREAPSLLVSAPWVLSRCSTVSFWGSLVGRGGFGSMRRKIMDVLIQAPRSY